MEKDRFLHPDIQNIKDLIETDYFIDKIEHEV
jgi:hypothetical protein